MSDTISKIEKYFNGTLAYPLMVVVSPEEYKEVLETFSNTSKIKVSDYCVGKDKEPDTDKLHADIKNVAGKYLLIGLGDYLASKSELARKTLAPYKDLLLQAESRVAILLSAHMFPFVKDIYNADPRVRTRIVLPKITPSVVSVSNNALVYGIKAYLETCEKGEVVGHVKTARTIQGTNVINAECAFDELRHKFPNEFNRLLKNTGTAENWGELLESLNKTKKNIGKYLAEQKFAPLEYTFLDYAKRSDYTAWLYFINLKLNTDSKSYLGLVASGCETRSNLLSVAKTSILDIPITDNRFKSFYEQRKAILKNASDVDMADFTSKIAVRGTDRIAYLTDNTPVERKETIIALCDGAKNDALLLSYPDLYLYMQKFIFEDNRFTEYFKAYKNCKLTNKIDDDFATLVGEYAESRPYNSLPARPSLLSDLDDGNTLLIFIDAMGVEYLGYIKEKCAELNLRFVAKTARAELPTVTVNNKIFFEEWKGKKETPIKDLDELKHHPERGYDFDKSPYPIHLAEELEVVKTALERAKIKLDAGECQKVVIASDHGASRLAVISPDVQIPNNGCISKSSGRYCVGENLPNALNIVTDGGYAVIADYSRFEGSRIASVETHGGATLEEVIVPVIELTLSNGVQEVTLGNKVIEVSFNIVPTLIFFVVPDCDNITALVDGEFYEVEKVEKSKFKVVMPNLKKGNYKLDVFENQNRIASKEITVKSKGFAERDLF